MYNSPCLRKIADRHHGPLVKSRVVVLASLIEVLFTNASPTLSHVYDDSQALADPTEDAKAASVAEISSAKPSVHCPDRRACGEERLARPRLQRTPTPIRSMNGNSSQHCRCLVRVLDLPPMLRTSCLTSGLREAASRAEASHMTQRTV